MYPIISAMTTPSASGSSSGCSKSPSSLSSSIEIIEENDESWDVIEDSNANNIKTIEVERKFMVPENYNERLLKNGFEIIQEFDEVLVDTYFDSHEHHLIKVIFKYYFRWENPEFDI